MQAPLAVLGFVLGALAWWQSGDAPWLLGALLMIANWPFTPFVIMPVNNRLNAMPPEAAGADSRALIERWGGLQAVRGALGAAAVASFLPASA
jgi:hypothetical protein